MTLIPVNTKDLKKQFSPLGGRPVKRSRSAAVMMPGNLPNAPEASAGGVRMAIGRTGVAARIGDFQYFEGDSPQKSQNFGK